MAASTVEAVEWAAVIAGLLSGVVQQKPLLRPETRLWPHGSRYLRAARAAITYRQPFFPTCYGVQFTNRARDRCAMEHIFGRVCRENGIEHRRTKVNHPWTNGPPLGDHLQSPAGQRVERMNRTIKEATVRRYHYADHDQLRQHLADFIAAYDYARRLKTLRGLTPYEHIVECWTEEPEAFRVNPTHHMPALNS